MRLQRYSAQNLGVSPLKSDEIVVETLKKLRFVPQSPPLLASTPSQSPPIDSPNTLTGTPLDEHDVDGVETLEDVKHEEEEKGPRGTKRKREEEEEGAEDKENRDDVDFVREIIDLTRDD